MGVHLNGTVRQDLVAFSLCARILGECSTIHSPPARFFVCLFFKQKLAHTHLFYSLSQDQSTVAWRAEMTVNECSPMSCV